MKVRKVRCRYYFDLRKMLMFCLTSYCIADLNAQPYIDLATVQYDNSPDAGIFRRANAKNHYEHQSVSLNIPYIFRKDSSLLLFGPFAEKFEARFDTASSLPDHFHSLVLPVTWVKPVSGKWELILAVMPRWNGRDNEWFKNAFQLSGAALISKNQSPSLLLRIGIYANNEFSGIFILPLAGIDWQINRQNRLFGILPGSLTFEHKAGSRFYYGAAFKAITNSYRADTEDASTAARFMRVDDNILSAFADLYILKNFVVNAELGHSVFRRFRLGNESDVAKYYFTAKMNDNFFFRLGLHYRMRLN